MVVLLGGSPDPAHGPNLSVDRDSVTVDNPQPLLSPEAFSELVRLFEARRFEGACLNGEVRHMGGETVLYVTTVSSAANLDYCTGLRRVGAVVFLYNPASDSELGQLTGRLLTEHPEWVAAGAVTGCEYKMMRNPMGDLEAGYALSAQFSVWTVDEVAQQT